MDKEAFDGWQEDQIPRDTIANIIYSIHRSHDILIHGIVLVGWWISKQDLKEDQDNLITYTLFCQSGITQHEAYLVDSLENSEKGNEIISPVYVIMLKLLERGGVSKKDLLSLQLGFVP